MTTIASQAMSASSRRVAARGALALATAVFILVGAAGLVRYVDNFWVYRGFAPPSDPAFVRFKGAAERLYVASAAIGGLRQPVDVYLPPGYASHPARRYPVFYLLHGVPGRPGAFLQTVRMGVVEDVLLARRKIQPMILVMPFGSTGSFTDKEWANGIGRNENWETFLTRDVVRAIDARYRTIPDGAHRALGGLSEGGYGALNIGLHHPARFRVLESWSGYARADDVSAVFGHRTDLLVRNSPVSQLAASAASFRADRGFIWFYTGSTDRLRADNQQFAAALRSHGVPFKFATLRGGHDWSLWRGQAANALLAASEHLGRGA
jgi:enterochelin esterase-like enzyme